MRKIVGFELIVGAAAVLVSASGLRAGNIVGTVGAPKPQHVVVYVENVPGTFHGTKAEMDQKGKVFFPYVLPVVQGTAVDFHNSDNLQHNVMGVGAAEFNLGAYGFGASKDETFTKLGQVSILCNVHPEMEAYILVLQNPYFAQPDGNGKFHIANVPAGSYVLKAWYQGRVKKQTVQVPAKGDVSASF